MTLREWRFKKSISQWEVSRLAQVHQSRVSLIENGFVARANEKKKIAHVLGVNSGDIDWPLPLEKIKEVMP